MLEKAVYIGDKKQLFIDDELVEDAENVRLAVNRPLKTGEKCIVAEYPWEDYRIGLYSSVMEDDGTYKMWYDIIDPDLHRWLCYVTSKDGIHWEKPMLEIVAYKNIKKTNILFPKRSRGPSSSEFELGCVFKDTKPNIPKDEKYKMICSYAPENGKPGLYVFASADGIHWQQLSDEPSFRPSDTANICFWDDHIGKYVAYVRVWSPMRKIGRCEFTDLTDWGKEEIVFSYDELDPQDMDFYNSAALKYPYADNVYLIFPSAYHHFPEPPIGKHRNDGILDIRFAVSRDGVAWKRPDRGSFIPLGVKGGWDDSMLFMTNGIFRSGNQLFMYYAGWDTTHAVTVRGAISRVTMRLDGFVSLDSGYTGGRIVTVPLTFRGDHLELNVETGIAGEVRVELLDIYGQPVPGYSLIDSDAIKGNSIDKTITWKGNPDVSKLADEPIKLHFFTRDAKLYAFQFK